MVFQKVSMSQKLKVFDHIKYISQKKVFNFMRKLKHSLLKLKNEAIYLNLIFRKFYYYKYHSITCTLLLY